MPSLGLIMILRNEEENLDRSLKPVAGLFDEVVAVDTGSIDKTREKAVSLGAYVYDLTWDDNFSAARNYSIAKAETDYLFWLDGDNAVSPKGVAKIRNALESAESGFIGWCREVLEPQGHTLIQKRLFPRQPDIFFSGRIHEQLRHPENLKFMYLDVDILHWGYGNPAAAKAKGLRNLDLLLRSLDSAPKDFFLLYQTGKTLFNLKRYAKAKEYLSQARDNLGTCPENPELAAHSLILLGLAQERLGDSKAEEVFLKVVQEGGFGKKLALYHLGRIWAEQGKAKQAIKLLEQVLVDQTQYLTLDLDLDLIIFRTTVLLARLHGQLKKIDQSVRYYFQAIELEPKTGFTWRELIKLLNSAGRNQEAKALLEKFKQNHPRDVSLKSLEKNLASRLVDRL